ncbi:MAG: ATP synthase F1 subunit delta [Bdellovibrionota bacterium]
MSDVIIAKRYAKAFVEASVEDVSNLRSDLRSLEYIQELFDIPETAKVLKSPVMPDDLKKLILEYAYKKCEKSDRINGLIEAIVKSKRVSVFPKIVTEISDILDSQEGFINAELTVASEFGDEQTAKISELLEKLMGKKVKLQLRVDPEILGGFVVQMGNYLLDLSVRAKLNAMTKSAAI